MSITYQPRSSLYRTEASSLVLPVNCEGIASSKLTRELVDMYPEILGPYVKACKKVRGSTAIIPGGLLVCPITTKRNIAPNLKYIVLAATKGYNRNKAREEWIIDICLRLKTVFERFDIRSINMPPIGCTEGGLNWAKMAQIVEEILGNCSTKINIANESYYAQPNTEVDFITKKSIETRKELVEKHAKSSYDKGILSAKDFA